MSTQTSEQALIEGVNKQLFIGGEWRDAKEGGTLSVEDPATGESLCEVADGQPEDALAALEAADKAQADWARTAPRQRGEILRSAFEMITERIDDLALLMTLEMGKPVADSKAEITYASEFFRWYSEQAVRIGGTYSISPDGNQRIMTMKQPVGPCLMITPWNFPMAMKPAKATPLSMLALAEILEEAGLPPGVLNVVTAASSSDIVSPIISDSRLRKLTFTGSTPIGRRLMEQASENLLRVSMELGGNAPFLVFEDADVDDAVAGAMVAKMRNIGEACTAANRFHVADSVADEFAEKLAEKMGQMKVARGTEEGAEVGPLIDEDQLGKVEELVNDAVDKGAKVLVGAQKLDGQGYFYEPTVLDEVPKEADLRYEEIFGPVAPVFSFDSEDEAINAANDTEYGLVAYVYTSNFNRAVRVIERLQTGMVGLNQGMVSNAAAPFGGIKPSGFGREGGYEGLEEYLETKYVAVNLPAEVPF